MGVDHVSVASGMVVHKPPRSQCHLSFLHHRFGPCCHDHALCKFVCATGALVGGRVLV